MVDAVLLAAGTPGAAEPLYALTRGRPKALLSIGGRPMVQWVLDALSGARTVRNVVIVGLAPEQASLACRKPLAFVQDHGSMLANLAAGAAVAKSASPPATHVLAVSSDIPLLTADAVDWIVTTSFETDHEAYYCLIARETVERRFPGSRRSFFKLKEGRFTGGDVSLFSLTLVGTLHAAWDTLIDARKSLLKQARLFGLEAVVLVAIGRLSIAGCVRRVRERLGVNVRVLVCPHPEAGMDVDKPEQFEMLARELEQHGRPR